jgi:hypothetical protein
MRSGAIHLRGIKAGNKAQWLKPDPPFPALSDPNRIEVSTGFVGATAPDRESRSAICSTTSRWKRGSAFHRRHGDRCARCARRDRKNLLLSATNSPQWRYSRHIDAIPQTD